MALMRTLSQQFFELATNVPAQDAARLGPWHSEMARQVPESHIQLVAAQLNLVYEEGTAIGAGLTPSYAALTKLTIGEC